MVDGGVRVLGSAADRKRGYGALVRGHRVANGLSQEELAEAAGISVRTIRNLEAGRVLPRRRTAAEIAAALDLVADDHDGLLASLRAQRGQRLAGRPQREALRPLCAFVGRRADLAELVEAFTPVRWRGPHAVLVTGQPGVGKTALALRAAQERGGAVVYLGLDANGPQPLDTDAALARLLTHLGMDEKFLPESTRGREAVYRVLSAERGGLLVLDDAADEAQVRALLPAGRDWQVLITSRRDLTGLRVVHRLRLDVPDHGDALAMLGGVAGGRAAAEPGAAAEVVELCGRLPLAIRLCGERLTSAPDTTLADFAARLRHEHLRLDVLDAGDHGVRDAIASSYDRLPARQRGLLRLIASPPWQRWAPHDAGVLCALPTEVAGRLLVRLAEAGLMIERDRGHYEVPELIRLFATEQPDAGRGTLRA